MFHHEEEDLRSRQKCTDCPCCVAFVFALFIFSGLYARVLSTGSLGKLYHGIDYHGQVCGVDVAVKDEPYLYWCMKSELGGVPEVSFQHPICVASCPGANGEGKSGMNSQGASLYGIEPDCAAVAGAGSMASYKTTVVLNRFCLPDPGAYPELSEAVSKKKLSDGETFAVESLSSIASAWPVLLGSFFVSVMLGYLFLVLLRHCAQPLIYLTIVACIAGFAIMGIFLLANAGTLSEQMSESMKSDVQFPKELTQHEEALTRTAAFVCFLISFLAVCFACCFHQSIEWGSVCVEVACDVIFEMPSLLLLPVIKAFFKGLLALILLVGFVELYSTSEISDGTDGVSPHLNHSNGQNAELLFYTLMSFWILCFVNALYQFIVAYGVCEYYYTPYDHDHEKDVGCCALWDGLYYGLITHGGSLALGSLLIAMLQVFQKVIQHSKKANDDAGGNKVVDCVLCLCLVCVSCCKEMVEYIDKNAYIDIVITSNSFCEAAQDAIAMIAELGGAMAVLNGATFVFTFFGTILITLGAGAFTYIVSSQGTFADQQSEFDVSNPIAPTVVACIIGMFVALSFMHVFDMTSDTLLYCYGHDNHNGRPTHNAPQALKELVHGTGGGKE